MEQRILIFLQVIEGYPEKSRITVLGNKRVSKLMIQKLYPPSKYPLFASDIHNVV